MTNIADFNFPAFDSATAHLRSIGWDVSNPHEHDCETYPGLDEATATKTGDVLGLTAEVGFSFSDAMLWDLAEVIRCDVIAMLPGWESSTGARIERLVAESCGKEILLLAASTNPNQGWYAYPDPVQKRIAPLSVIPEFVHSEG